MFSASFGSIIKSDFVKVVITENAETTRSPFDVVAIENSDFTLDVSYVYSPGILIICKISKVSELTSAIFTN